MWTTTRLSIAAIVLLSGLEIVRSVEVCPRPADSPSFPRLECGVACCPSFEGGRQGYYCCGLEEHTRLVADDGEAEARRQRAGAAGTTRAERFVHEYQMNNLKIDYTLFVIGLIVSIVLSILFSFICCLLCNGCWLHRRRNPHMYESVRHQEESGWYPICCGFGFPLGTVVLSSHPPQFRDDNDVYNGSSMSSLPSSKQRVRFNPDGTPRGVLKNGNGNGHDF